MSKKKLIGPNRTILFPVIAVMVLSSMLWDIVSAYVAGGDDAPSTPILVVAIVVLGGGTVFSVIQAWRTWKALNEEEQKKAEEQRKKAQEQPEALPEEQAE